MLKWNWKKLFKARGIDRPIPWLKKLLISRDVAYRIAHNKCDKISLKTLTKVCRALNCTPDDALEFVPTESDKKSPNLGMLALVPNEKWEDAADLLRGLNAKQLKEIAKTIRKAD